MRERPGRYGAQTEEDYSRGCADRSQRSPSSPASDTSCIQDQTFESLTKHGQNGTPKAPIEDWL
jgi:hypothetical protein